MPYIIAVIILVVAGVGFALFQNKSTSPVVSVDETPVVEIAETPTTPTPPAVTNDFKNGTYKSQVTYLTPMKSEYLLDISLTVTDDIITDATVAYSQGAEVDPNAQRFEAAYRAEVIGTDLGTINLSRVGGASLTTGAFNKALTEIKADAGV